MKVSKQTLAWIVIGFLGVFLVCSVIMFCQPNLFVRFCSILPTAGAIGCSFILGMIYNEYVYLKKKEEQHKKNRS